MSMRCTWARRARDLIRDRGLELSIEEDENEGNHAMTAPLWKCRAWGDVFGWTVEQKDAFDILDAFVAGGGLEVHPLPYRHLMKSSLRMNPIRASCPRPWRAGPALAGRST